MRLYLSEIVFISRVPPGDVSGEAGPVLQVLPVIPGATEGVGEVVGGPGLIVSHRHGPVSLVVPETKSSSAAVLRQLLTSSLLTWAWL